MLIEKLITFLFIDEAEAKRERNKQGDGMDKCRKHRNNIVVNKVNLLQSKTRN